MKIDQAQLDKVEVKLNKQNAFLAAIAAAFWAIPLILMWYFVHVYYSSFSAVMLLINGLLVGFVVRIHGKGLTGVFSLIAILVHTSIVLAAFSLNIVLTGTTWAFLLFGLYIAGVIGAKKISRIEVPFEEHRAFSFFTSTKPHESNKKLKNKWYIVLPTLLLTMALSLYASILGLAFFNEYQVLTQQEQQRQQQRQNRENREIDIMPAALDSKSTQEVLLYSYAYHSGLLFNKYGRRSEVFPQSEYKALALLRYLVEYRNNARAKFILGFLTGETKGSEMLQAAADQKDPYARIYSTVSFGCYSNEDLAVELLQKLRNTATEEYIREEISSILYLGIKDVCRDFEQPEFMLSYVINYSEK